MRKAAVSMFVLASTVAAAAAFAQQKPDSMKGMDMKGMDMGRPAVSDAKTYRAVGVVRALDAAAGTVTFAHEAIKSLNWPAMTMSFNVKDKTLYNRLAQGKKVEFEFVEEGENYVVTAVK